jgi:hypothetical protein
MLELTPACILKTRSTLNLGFCPRVVQAAEWRVPVESACYDKDVRRVKHCSTHAGTTHLLYAELYDIVPLPITVVIYG